MFTKVIKLSAMVLVLALLIGCLTACPSQIYSDEHIAADELESEIAELESQIESIDTSAPKPSISKQSELTIWSYTTEIKTLMIAFMEAHPEVDINYVDVSMEDSVYQDSVIDAANSNDCPDIVVLEANFVKQFVDSDMLLDLSDLKPYADELKTYSNTIEIGTNFETGEVRAYSYQNTVGAVFYRRSLANEYFGTDDPAEIQALMSDMDKFTDMAKTVNEKSSGKTFMVSSYSEISNAIFANREQPWFVNGSLIMDPIVDDFFETAKIFRENGYEANQEQWYQGWYDGMNDNLTDVNGDPVQVFCYFLPTWGLPYILLANSSDTAGDWACCPGPLPYQWGGTWLGVMKNAANPDIAKEFVRFCTLDVDNLTNWATGVYTYDYLEAISPEDAFSYGYELSQSAGDFVSSQVVVEAIASEFDDCEMSEFLGGQNPYTAFAEAAQNCKADMIHEYDDAIQYYYLEAVELYASGAYTKEEAIAVFENNVIYSYFY